MTELRQLARLRYVAKTIFMMPPPRPGVDFKRMWTGAQEVGLAEGLRLPAYHPDGQIFQLNDAGSLGRSSLFHAAKPWLFRIAYRRLMEE